MKLGFIVLAHQGLDRTAQLVSHLSDEGCSIAVHIDKHVASSDFNGLKKALDGRENVWFTKRTHCEWGRFSLVQATLDAATELLERAPKLDHICLISGSCLPIRPIKQMKKFLARNKQVDFIESVSVANNFWVKDGLNEERFTLYFPFSWRNQRRLFDRSVDLQRKLGVKRKVPDDVIPHIGSQWWCLTAKTLRAILNDKRRQYFDNYFSWSWIPDESYFQTLTRLHARKIESRSLTFSRFDYLGRPFTLYDDHLPELSKSNCFFARKIWHGADKLYETLLSPDRANQPLSTADPKAFEAPFEAADELRCEGGVGRFHQGRFPYNQSKNNSATACDFTVFVGFRKLYDGFPDWVAKNTDAKSYGSLFARSHVAGRPADGHFAGNLPAEMRVRNRNPKGYLSNLLWMNRHEHQTFLFDFRDHPTITKTIAFEHRATIVMIQHAWLLELLNKQTTFDNILTNARRYHKLEQTFLAELDKKDAASTVVNLPLDFAVHDPVKALEKATAHIGLRRRTLKAMPFRVNTDGLDGLVRRLRNNGLPLVYQPAPGKGDPVGLSFEKPYVVK
ncbi:MAG: beta-1,6-N-acetylglucosaminyltransferase [Pseudomonadota bacterium]